MTLRPLRLMLLGLLLGGCIPHVGHAPRVEAGPRFFINAAVSHVAELQDEQMVAMPSLYVGGTRGWVWDNGVAAHLGAQLPILAFPIQLLSGDDLEQTTALILLDGYIQPRRSADTTDVEYGFGAMLSRGMVVPYVQVGGARAGSVYTTQAVAITFDTFNRVIYWVPSVSLRSLRPDGRRAVNYYAGATVGWQDTSSGETRREWVVTVGVVAEFTRRR